MGIWVINAQRRCARCKRVPLVSFEHMAGKLQRAHSGLIWGRRTCTLKFSSEETSIERKVVCRDHRTGKPLAKFLGDVFE
jgi:hypothetical protein